MDLGLCDAEVVLEGIHRMERLFVISDPLRITTFDKV